MLHILLILSVVSLISNAQDDAFEKLVQRVPGIPGEDYPIFAIAPDTSFLCEVQSVEGYYADQEADCQVYHVCSDIGDGLFSKFDFLCPNGTIFNQEEFVCDWWFNVDCSNADAYYALNIEVAEQNAERQRLREEGIENGVEQEKRKRKELSSEQISDLRNGITPEESSRSSGTKSSQSDRKLGLEPKPGNTASNSPFLDSSKKSKPFRGSSRGAGPNLRENKNKKNGAKAFTVGHLSSKESKKEGNKKAFSKFSANTVQSSRNFGGGIGFTQSKSQSINRFSEASDSFSSSFGITQSKASSTFGSSRNPSNGQRAFGRNKQKTKTAAPAGRTRSSVANLRNRQQAGKKSKVKPFTSFGNNKKRFG